MKIFKLENTDSTNNYCKKLVSEIREDAVVIAKTQSGGHGTKGRSFSSCKGGVYLSKLAFYPCKAKDSFKLMIKSALAVVMTLKAFNVNAVIKWPNDVFVNGKKICGILIENNFQGDDVFYSITGIGINVNNELPEGLSDIAISVKQIVGEQNIDAVSSTLIYNLNRDYTVEEYKKYSCVLGKEITVIKGGKIFKALAADITSDGRLVLDSGEELLAAEVSIR